ncbi:uncharacterized protein K444DRAFT_607084 [Hyaloscypha bicolor E]|uniref:Uncharacterized protein n=1 Tax=Hyaloscypha bicolor E TaxID=1095630 RepID=A0A2J6TUV2_9HELO|nr:uncharacterized protein K444DRAFT_607084 [Hyaloscypha bicolor E]PMD66787.1 hypothetical protein K444DRAFT_607084 [Hyaloscypha bicolor E]
MWYGMKTVTSNVSWEIFECFRQTNADFWILGVKLRDISPRWIRSRDSVGENRVQILSIQNF